MRQPPHAHRPAPGATALYAVVLFPAIALGLLTWGAILLIRLVQQARAHLVAGGLDPEVA